MTLLTHFIAALKRLSRPLPARDWALATLASMVVTIVLMGVALYYYVGLQSGSIIVTHGEPTTDRPSVSKTALTAILTTYQDRARSFESGTIRVPKATDPSR